MSDETTSQLARALTSLREMRARLEAAEGAHHEPIAIVGMGCRLPGAPSPAALWDLVRRGGDAVIDTPPGRWDAAALFDESPEAAGRVATRWGGFLEGIDEFDAAFFGISPREAVQMDPQQRLLLEVAFEALEDAGQTVEGLAGSATGVFVGVHSHSDDYFTMQAADPLGLDLYSGTGTSHSVLSGRLSYLLDLHGPSVAVDTACSSSLVAVHLAVQSLRTGETSLALAGGVNVIIEPTFTMVASRMRMMSPTGRCRPFDRGADGFVRAEGCAAVVLKRLRDARHDGDRVLAVIAGSAVNQDGRSNGLTAPSGASQQAVVRAALADARLTADAVGYVEAHGTGTPLGDPIEVEALTAVFTDTERTGDQAPIALGSVKSNIGHTEGASGVAALVKAVLVVRSGEIPPLVHFRELNPHISLDATRFVIPTEPQPWPGGDRRRVAGVSSFGWSGTNAHVIVAADDAPAPAPAVPDAGTSLLLVLSARSEGALFELAAAYRALLDAAPIATTRAVCAQAARRRSHHACRLALAGRTGGELVECLSAFAAAEERRELTTGTARRGATVFVYPGQGGQWPGMGRGLLAADAAFAEELSRCAAALQPHLGWSVVDRLRAGDEVAIERIDVVQPLLFAVQVAMTAMWLARGVRPSAVVGHSMGEVAAAHAAGILTLDEAALVICTRSALLQRIAGRGAMGVVALDADAAQREIAGVEDRLAVAVTNGPGATVLSGEPAALDRVLGALDARGVFARRVNVDVASHSPQVAELTGELTRSLAGIRPGAATTSFVSTVTGTFIDGGVLGAGYWARNLRERVRFDAAVAELLGSGHDRFVEIGPHPVLLESIDAALAAAGRAGATVATTWREADEELAVTVALGALHVDGQPLDWARLYPEPGEHVDLPPYPWQRERHWLDLPADASSAGRGPRHDELLGWPVPVATSTPATVWERTVDRRAEPAWFAHRIGGSPSLPASALVALMSRAAQRAGDSPALEDVRFERLLHLDDDVPTRVQVVVEPGAGGRRVSVSRWDGEGWTRHASAALAAAAPAPAEVTAPPTRRRTDGGDHYRALAAAGIELGPALQSLVAIERGDGGVAATATLTAPVDGLLGPLDATLQVALLAGPDDGVLRMPVGAASVTATVACSAELHCTASVRAASGGGDLVVDVVAADADGMPVATVTGLRLRRLGRADDRIEEWVHDVVWRPADGAPGPAAAPGTWLVVTTDEGTTGDGALAAALAAELGAGAMVTGAARAAAALSSAGSDLRGVVLVAAASTTSVEEPDEPLADRVMARQRHAATFVELVGAVDAHAARAPISVVTRDVHRIGGGSGSGFADATLWGLGRALAEELPDLAGTMIDLAADTPPAEAARAVAMEVCCAASGSASGSPEREVAVRGGTRLVARLGHVPLGAGSPRPPATDATHLVTGGFGAIGTHVARRLVARGARRVALLGRTALPPRAAWSGVEPTTPVGRRIAAVRDLEAAGAAVHLIVADVGQPDRLRAALDAFAAEGWPAVRSVHHTAAVFGGELLGELDAATLDAQLRPKLVGTCTLVEVLDELDELVLYSSIAALLPMAGQAAYAAGNAFLDAAADYLGACGREALSVQWGFWDGSSDDLAGEAGQPGAHDAATFKDAARKMAEARGMRGFSAERGLDVLDRLLAGDAHRAMVLPVDWSGWGTARAGRPLALVADLVATAAPPAGGVPHEPTLRERLAAAPPADHGDLVEATVRRLLGQVLKQPEARIDGTQPFGTMGLDSLMATELRNRVEAVTGLSLSATLAWNYPSVRDLSAHLLERLVGTAAPQASAAASPAADPSPAATGARLDELTAAVAELSDDDALGALLGEGGA